MIVSPHPQGSVEWMIARAGIPTASEFDALITPKWKIKTGEGPKTYLHKKLAEWWQGGPLMSFNTFDVEQGQMLEHEAKPFAKLEYGLEITNVGLVTTDDGMAGCSPDGLIGDDSGIEIKCPAVHTHVGYLLGGELPDEYAAQVHGSMYVTGRSSWRFMSYRRHFPPVMLLIERDDEIQKQIAEALAIFLEAFDDMKKRLIELNGGPPRRKSARMEYPKPAEPEEGEVIP